MEDLASARAAVHRLACRLISEPLGADASVEEQCKRIEDHLIGAVSGAERAASALSDTFNDMQTKTAAALDRLQTAADHLISRR